MNSQEGTFNGFKAPFGKRKLSRDTVFLIGDLLPLLDFTGVLLAAWLSSLFYASSLSAVGASSSVWAVWDDGGRAALAAAVLAPFILCDRAFVSFASGGQTVALIRCFAVRFLMFAGVVVTIGLASHSLENLSRAWLAWWFVSSLAVTAITRILLVGTLRRLERNGILTERIAVIGAGPDADRLIQHLRQTRGASVEILGVFDDRVSRTEDCAHAPAGSIADLLTLGQSRPMDWMLLVLPGSAQRRLHSIVHRLKALAVPVGLCPRALGSEVPLEGVRYAGAGLPVTLLADRPHTPWHPIVAAVDTVVPRWIITLLSLPLNALAFLFAALRKLQPRRAQPRTLKVAVAQKENLVCALDPYDVPHFTEVAAHFGQSRYGYVVTPNADHLIRLHREPSFRKLYADAAYVLLDSRFISHLLRLTRKLRLPVCPGSDLTASLFDHVILPDDRLVLIGGGGDQAARISERYGLKQLAHFNPPMGFIRDPAALEACLQFIESHSPFRYCLLAVGAPQQEIVAQGLKTRGVARGLALCIGGSINFLTGDEHRAPRWMQRGGLEWLFRLAQAPGRLASRYLIRGPQVFGLLQRTEIILRPAPNSPQVAIPSNTMARPVPALYRNKIAAYRAADARRATARRESAHWS